MKFAETAPADMAPADFVKFMRDKFGREIRIERVIAAKGENAYIDYLAFGELGLWTKTKPGLHTPHLTVKYSRPLRKQLM